MHGDTEESNLWAAQLYDSCAAELILYGRALGLGHVEAEDVLHDTFRALLRLGEPPRDPRFYLVRSFRNRVHNHRRGLWRRLQREMESRQWFEPDPSRPPETEAAARGLAKLPPAQREVIVLKLWHNLTFETIGELLSISPNTAAGRYRYGLQKLRSTLEKPDHEPVRDHGSQPAWLPSAPALPEG